MLWRTAPGYLVLATVHGKVIEVEGPGCDVWIRLADWTTEEDLIAGLTQKYGAARAVVSRDLRGLLRELHAQGYVDPED